jgi:imidazolonepropionase-like amidohydrolase
MRTRLRLVLLGVIGFGVTAAGVVLDRRADVDAAPPPPVVQSARTAIVNARVFDGDVVWPRATVVIDGDHIAAIGPDVSPPAGAAIIDGTDRTLLPGLIDAHTHASGDALERAVIFGVTTELDMFADPTFAANMRSEQQKTRVTTRADLRSAGVLVTAPGGHGTEYGFSIPTLKWPSEARDFVAARVAEGSDYIKLVKDNGSMYGLSWPTLSNETLAAAIAAAHWQQRMTLVHIGSQADAFAAIDAGVDGLAHLFEDSAPRPDFIAKVVAHHIFVVPTLTVLESETGKASGASLVTDPDLGPKLRRDERDSLSASFHFKTHMLDLNHARAAVAALVAAGVPILAGTDAGNPGTAHGASLHRELELLVSAGMTPVQALRAATSVPARVFSLRDRGRIAPGFRADLVLVAGEPDRDILATRRIVAVWRNGAAVAR